jgi:hypothetical protein
MPDGSLALPLGVAEHCNPDTTPDWPQVTPLIERLIKIAKGHGGEFLVATVGSEDPKTGKKLAPLNLHIPNDDNAREGLLSAIGNATRQHGNNCYLSIALFRPGLTGAQKGKEVDVVGVLAAVTDWDGKNDPATRHDRLPLSSMAEVETSLGNFQCWYFFDRPYSVAEAKPVLTALSRYTKSDSTHSCDHVFRMPGTLNWPSQAKIAKGRSRVPWRARLTWILEECVYPNTSLDGLRAAIVEKYPDAFGRSDGSAGENHTGDAGRNGGFPRRPPKVKGIKRQISSTGASDIGEFDWSRALKSNYRPLTEQTVYRKLNLTDGDRSEIAYGMIHQCASRGYRPQQVFDLLMRHATLPVMRHYADHTSGMGKSLRDDIIRAFTKLPGPAPQSAPKIFKACPHEETGEPSSSDRPARREIKLVGDYLPTAVDEAEKALIEQGVDIFQRGSSIVRPAAARVLIRGGAEIDGEQLFQVQPNEMREHMTSAAIFLRWDARNEEFKPINCPEDVARAYLERRGRWHLLYLKGIITAPTLRADGPLVDRPGYDDATGLLFLPASGADFPAIPDMPTREDALAALKILKDLLGTFPFETNADLSVALSAILTAVIRPTLKTAPMHVFSAPRRGSGKGKLADIAAVIATGREASAIVQGRTEEETEKRLVAMLLSGDAVILLDNCTLPLEGDFLNAMLTAATVKPRILGKSEAPKLPANVTMLATGNNLTAKGDMTRRVLRCTIDPKMEYPEHRDFMNEPVADAKRDRLQYLAAALTILRAYIVAGRPKMSVPLGSFEQWNMVRDTLIWLDEADPCDTKEAVEADDLEKDQLAAVLQGWHDLIGTDRVSTKELIERASAGATFESGKPHSGLLDALGAVAPATKGDAAISPDRLGKYLSRNVKVVVGDKRLMQDGTRARGKLWRLEIVGDDART